ncbi:Reticulon-like protein [Drosera capensis]
MDDDPAVATVVAAAAPKRKPTTGTSATGSGCGGGGEAGKAMMVMVMVSATLVYYHCAYRNSTFLSLVSDVFIVILSSLAILGLLFRHFNTQVPVDPLEWQISQEGANGIVACLANTVGAAESVLRVAATGYDKRLFLKVVFSLYMLSVLGRLVSGLTVAYAAESSEFFSRRRALSSARSDGTDEM